MAVGAMGSWSPIVSWARHVEGGAQSSLFPAFNLHKLIRHHLAAGWTVRVCQSFDPSETRTCDHSSLTGVSENKFLVSVTSRQNIPAFRRSFMMHVLMHLDHIV